MCTCPGSAIEAHDHYGDAVLLDRRYGDLFKQSAAQPGVE
jgi:hypothetical protein